jgi:transposase
MAEAVISEEFWNEVRPLLPEHPPDPRGGAPRAADRKCFEGIAYVLRTGCQWQMLPASDRWPSGSTCWRRFTEWSRAGVWPRLHRKLLNRLGKAGQIELDTVVVDSASVRAKKGARTPAPARSIVQKTAVKGTLSPMSTVCRC